MASKYPFPGVWTQRVDRPQPPREISPSSMAVVGFTTKGPVNVPTRVSSWNEFVDAFGGLTDDSMVPMTGFQFYENGGQYIYVNRVVPAGSLTASIVIDAPTKWTVNHLYPGAYGNSIAIDIAGNQAFLNRTTYAWDRFDVFVLEPDQDGNLVASEFFEAVQFTDPSLSSYITKILDDPEQGSALVQFVIGAGGTPVGLVSTTIADEVIGVGAPPQTQFLVTLANSPVLTSTLRIVAPETQVDDQPQTPTLGTVGTDTNYTLTIPSAPVMDNSVRLFYQRLGIYNEALTPDTGVIGTDTVYVFDAATVANPVHRESTIFRLKYAKTAASSPETIGTIGGAPATFDLSTATGPTDLPVHPGTMSITVTISAAPQTITDTPLGDGTGTLAGTGGSLPLGGTIVYATGVMTGTTSSLDASTNVVATYNQSSVATKTDPIGDNMAQDVALAGAVVVGVTSTIDLVDSITSPATSGELKIECTSVPILATSFYIDYVALGIVNDDVDGNLTGIPALGTATPIYTNTVDFETGDLGMVLPNVPLALSTIDADYQTGQVVEDNGLGFLTGDIDPSGTNTINYETGAVNVTFTTAPLVGASILANYVELEDRIRWQLAGGSNGSGTITRAEVSDPALELSGGGIYALKGVEDVFQLAIPDFAGSVLVSRDQLDFCESLKRAFAVLATPEDLSSAEAKQWRYNDLGVFSKWGAVYYPWEYVQNQSTGFTELYPPIGATCGVYARTDQKANVGQSPAGTEFGTVFGAVGPEYKLDDGDLQAIFESGMNALRASEATGFVVWGARTLERDNPDWQFVNAQRLFTFLEYSAYRITQFLVFGNNGPALWKRAELALSGWLLSLFNAGYFAGQTPSQAFYVICDDSNNSQATIEQGIVNIDIAAAPFRPAEFIVIRITQKAREQV